MIAAEPKGVPAARLLRIADFGGDPAHHQRRLTRLVEELNRAGWDIRSTALRGQNAVYRAFTRDNRLRVRLNPEQQAELARAALIAGDTVFADRLGIESTQLPQIPKLHSPAVRGTDDALNKVLHALEYHCLLHFTYKQQPRVVHPHFVQPGTSGWHLIGHEDGGAVEKQFVTDRMTAVTIDHPGTARPHDEPHRAELDPLTWAVDPPTDVVVETTPEHRARVEMLLGSRVFSEVDDDVVRLTVPVTHRAAFRDRIYELGRLVRIVEPAEVRDELVAELATLAE
ncbi:helix-turn-helix transcriptional regulator [Haloactinopolyspora alba]|uniref:helix-turn-helix transcriptional regulator n=1 Tax=Haloactinopolyspora alba TaxID=648780 RepID=UPI0013EE1B25|nr:WYL domain-containing protein [Haloactinopolyspora alba]